MLIIYNLALYKNKKTVMATNRTSSGRKTLNNFNWSNKLISNLKIEENHYFPLCTDVESEGSAISKNRRRRRKKYVEGKRNSVIQIGKNVAEVPGFDLRDSEYSDIGYTLVIKRRKKRSSVTKSSTTLANIGSDETDKLSIMHEESTENGRYSSGTVWSNELSVESIHKLEKDSGNMTPEIDLNEDINKLTTKHSRNTSVKPLKEDVNVQLDLENTAATHPEMKQGSDLDLLVDLGPETIAGMHHRDKIVAKLSVDQEPTIIDSHEIKTDLSVNFESRSVVISEVEELKQIETERQTSSPKISSSQACTTNELKKTQILNNQNINNLSISYEEKRAMKSFDEQILSFNLEHTIEIINDDGQPAVKKKENLVNFREENNINEEKDGNNKVISNKHIKNDFLLPENREENTKKLYSDDRSKANSADHNSLTPSDTTIKTDNSNLGFTGDIKFDWYISMEEYMELRSQYENQASNIKGRVISCSTVSDLSKNTGDEFKLEFDSHNHVSFEHLGRESEEKELHRLDPNCADIDYSLDLSDSKDSKHIRESSPIAAESLQYLRSLHWNDTDNCENSMEQQTILCTSSNKMSSQISSNIDDNNCLNSLEIQVISSDSMNKLEIEEDSSNDKAGDSKPTAGKENLSYTNEPKIRNQLKENENCVTKCTDTLKIPTDPKNILQNYKEIQHTAKAEIVLTESTNQSKACLALNDSDETSLELEKDKKLMHDSESIMNGHKSSSSNSEAPQESATEKLSTTAFDLRRKISSSSNENDYKLPIISDGEQQKYQHECKTKNQSNNDLRDKKHTLSECTEETNQTKFHDNFSCNKEISEFLPDSGSIPQSRTFHDINSEPIRKKHASTRNMEDNNSYNGTTVKIQAQTISRNFGCRPKEKTAFQTDNELTNSKLPNDTNSFNHTGNKSKFCVVPVLEDRVKKPDGKSTLSGDCTRKEGTSIRKEHFDCAPNFKGKSSSLKNKRASSQESLQETVTLYTQKEGTSYVENIQKMLETLSEYVYKNSNLNCEQSVTFSNYVTKIMEISMNFVSKLSKSPSIGNLTNKKEQKVSPSSYRLSKKCVPRELTEIILQPKWIMSIDDIIGRLRMTAAPDAVIIQDLRLQSINEVIITCRSSGYVKPIVAFRNSDLFQDFYIQDAGAPADMAKVVLFDIPSGFVEDDIVRCLSKRFPEVNRANVIFQKYFASKTNDYNCIFSLPKSAAVQLWRDGHFFLNFISCPVYKYVSVIRCDKCQRYWHNLPECTFTAVCAKCAENHYTLECKNPADIMRCTNCLEANQYGYRFNYFHYAHSQSCPVYRREIENAKRINI